MHTDRKLLEWFALNADLGAPLAVIEDWSNDSVALVSTSIHVVKLQ